MTPVFLDFETTHPDPSAPIDDSYAASCRVVCLGALLRQYAVVWCPAWRGVPTITVDRTIVHVHSGNTIPDEIRLALTLDPPCAHNAIGFDSRVWSEKVPASATIRGNWIDTLPLARLIGLPGSLDEIGQRLIGRGKDADGKQALERLHPYIDFGADYSLAFVRPYNGLSFGADAYSDTVHEILDAIVRYNVRDLLILRALWDRITDYFGRELERLPEFELRVWELDGRINQRGFPFDRQLAEWLISADAALADDRAERIRSLGPSNLRSGPQLKTWLAARGHDVSDVSRATLTGLLDDPALSDEVRLVVEARLGTVRTTTQKLRAGIDSAYGLGRIRNSLVYCGAHTGRWAGRGFQPQNLPRGLEITAEERSAITRAIMPSIDGPNVADLKLLSITIGNRLGRSVQPEALLSSLVLDVISAPAGKRLIYGDFASIEARTLCWLANDPALSIYRDRARNPYRELAAALFGCRPEDVPKGTPRYQVGKAAVLGCGYGMGAARFAALCAASGIDLSAIGLEPQAVVQAYRRQYRAVVQWWADLESAVRSLALPNAAGIRLAGRVTLRRVGDSVVCDLPSGRPMVWRKAAIEADSELVYEPPRAIDSLPKLYGGKIAENVTQAVCRDILADALLRADSRGLDIVLHVHDEIVIESRDCDVVCNTSTLRDVMTTPPVWAPDLPLDAEISE